MARVRRAGMTLVEVLVTLAIVGVMATMVVLGLGESGRDLTVATEANRLKDRLGFAVDEGLVTRRHIALAWDERGYRFLTQGPDGGWTPDIHALLADRHDLPRGMVLDGDAPALIVLSDGATRPFEMSMRSGVRSWHIRFDGLTATAAAVRTDL